MIVWRGWGFLPVILLVVLALAIAAIDGALGTHNAWITVVLTLVAGVANWFLGRRFNRPLQQAGVGFARRHSLFWIPMEWWSVAFVAVAVILIPFGSFVSPAMH